MIEVGIDLRCRLFEFVGAAVLDTLSVGVPLGGVDTVARSKLDASIVEDDPHSNRDIFYYRYARLFAAFQLEYDISLDIHDLLPS